MLPPNCPKTQNKRNCFSFSSVLNLMLRSRSFQVSRAQYSTQTHTYTHTQTHTYTHTRTDDRGEPPWKCGTKMDESIARMKQTKLTSFAIRDPPRRMLQHWSWARKKPEGCSTRGWSALDHFCRYFSFSQFFFLFFSSMLNALVSQTNAAGALFDMKDYRVFALTCVPSRPTLRSPSGGCYSPPRKTYYNFGGGHPRCQPKKRQKYDSKTKHWYISSINGLFFFSLANESFFLLVEFRFFLAMFYTSCIKHNRIPYERIRDSQLYWRDLKKRQKQ